MDNGSDLTEARRNQTIRERAGLRPIINLSGSMTALAPRSATAEIAPQFVEMDDLHRAASKVTLAIAGAITAPTSLRSRVCRFSQPASRTK
jgi:seryl-tRNA(Sec) selenium transferase